MNTPNVNRWNREEAPMVPWRDCLNCFPDDTPPVRAMNQKSKEINHDDDQDR